jgi:hypothetical protein
LLNIADELAHEVGDPRAIGFVSSSRGVAACQLGRWRAALEQCELAEVVLRERCQGVAWELTTVRLFKVCAMAFLGQMARVVEFVPAALREAEERGDLNGAVGLQTGLGVMAWLTRDAADEAEWRVNESRRRWSQRGYQVPHFLAWMSSINVMLYRGRGADALALVERERRLIERSFLLRIQLIRVIDCDITGRAALSAARQAAPSERRRLLKNAAMSAKALEREGSPWATGLGKLLQVQILVAGGFADEALRALPDAEASLLAADLHLHAAVARRARGRMLGGEQGKAEVRSAEGWIAGQRVARADAMSGMLAPYEFGEG